ncbi:hypothetical protein QO058_28005 [Bosea vestrisii]|uniref:hypothetical protein n=1 Tax=Bosea vestrisii TaxID=151416 RepID=UPI0024DF3DE9|nr:hypothetical protein [Bosea vestrisii]WID96513.1 hypothetical protein QO058_28005 [Bosea vestrisii]
MKPTVEHYTIALPWYEPEDFAELWGLAHDKDEMPPEYEIWHQTAVAVMNVWLSRGKALQLVTIRPKPFLEWLEARELPNTAETRRRYVELLASRAGDAA